jgi:hypothetical protein
VGVVKTEQDGPCADGATGGVCPVTSYPNGIALYVDAQRNSVDDIDWTPEPRRATDLNQLPAWGAVQPALDARVDRWWDGMRLVDCISQWFVRVIACRS